MASKNLEMYRTFVCKASFGLGMGGCDSSRRPLTQLIELNAQGRFPFENLVKF
jgi:hypothetical protein